MNAELVRRFLRGSKVSSGQLRLLLNAPADVLALCTRTEKEFLDMCKLQCAHRDRKARREGRNERDQRDQRPYTQHTQRTQRTQHTPQHAPNLRPEKRHVLEDIHRLECLTFVWGMQEPVDTKRKVPRVTPKLVRVLRDLHDVVHIRRFVVLERRFFTPEKHAWAQVSGGRAAVLIDIKDWTLPSAANLLRFALEVEAAAKAGEYLGCHCIAGAGRTGVCFLFLITLLHYGPREDLVDLLVKLAKWYAPKASVEIITMIHNRKFSARDLLLIYREAASLLLKHFGDWTRSVAFGSAQIPSVPFDRDFTPKQKHRLCSADLHIRSCH